MWQYTGQQKPDFAAIPGEGQESVWDYPRPPALVIDRRDIHVGTDARPIAATTTSYRVLETASPPTFYIPADAIDFEQLQPTEGSSHCEWKGSARYWALAGGHSHAIAWSYPDPTPAFTAIKDWLAFYPGRIPCYINGERVAPQVGGFYGGWVTHEIIGPWKGKPGTEHW